MVQRILAGMGAGMALPLVARSIGLPPVGTWRSGAVELRELHPVVNTAPATNTVTLIWRNHIAASLEGSDNGFGTTMSKDEKLLAPRPEASGSDPFGSAAPKDFDRIDSGGAPGCRPRRRGRRQHFCESASI
jgi:hypothetical protein